MILIGYSKSRNNPAKSPKSPLLNQWLKVKFNKYYNYQRCWWMMRLKNYTKTIKKTKQTTISKWNKCRKSRLLLHIGGRFIHSTSIVRQDKFGFHGFTHSNILETLTLQGLPKILVKTKYSWKKKTMNI